MKIKKIKGSYRGMNYQIVNGRFCPCAYVDVSNTPLVGRHYDDINIACHGGLTYSGPADNDGKGYVIGWDYGHVGDSHYSIKEIINDCLNVINQILR